MSKRTAPIALVERGPEAAHDLPRRLDGRDRRDALPRLPAVPRRRALHRRVLQPECRPQRVPRADPVLRRPALEHEAADRTGLRPHPLDERRLDNGQRNARDTLGRDDVLLVGIEDRLLVVVVRRALRRRDEARPALDARVPEIEHRAEFLRAADAARADERKLEIDELGVELLGALLPEVPARPPVHADEPVDALRRGLLGPAPVHDVVVDDASRTLHAIHDPARVPEGRDEEPDTLLERDIDVLRHALGVDGREGLLREHIESHGLLREGADLPHPGAEVTFVDEDEGERLDDADPARLRDGGDELGVGAGIHRAADERHLDVRRFGEGGLHRAFDLRGSVLPPEDTQSGMLRERTSACDARFCAPPRASSSSSSRRSPSTDASRSASRAHRSTYGPTLETPPRQGRALSPFPFSRRPASGTPGAWPPFPSSPSSRGGPARARRPWVAR